MSIRLVCKGVIFHGLKDEDMFFEWIQKIDCIESFSEKSDELYLDIASNGLHDNDLRDLIALFYRYKIENMKQLALFLNDNNRDWFYNGSPKAYWHHRIFGTTSKSKNLGCSSINVYPNKQE